MKKKTIIMIVALLFVSIGFSGVAGYAMGQNDVIAKLAKHIKITNDGREIDTGNDVPLLYNNRTYLPVRVVSEALGYDIEWFSASSTVNISKPDSAYPIISKDGVEIVDSSASVTIRGDTAIHSVSVIINQTKSFSYEPILIFEVLKNGVVVDSQLVELEKTTGRYVKDIKSSQFFHSLGTSLTADEKLKKYNEQYSYRLKIK